MPLIYLAADDPSDRPDLVLNNLDRVIALAGQGFERTALPTEQEERN